MAYGVEVPVYRKPKCPKAGSASGPSPVVGKWAPGAGGYSPHSAPIGGKAGGPCWAKHEGMPPFQPKLAVEGPHEVEWWATPDRLGVSSALLKSVHVLIPKRTVPRRAW